MQHKCVRQERVSSNIPIFPEDYQFAIISSLASSKQPPAKQKQQEGQASLSRKGMSFREIEHLHRAFGGYLGHPCNTLVVQNLINYPHAKRLFVEMIVFPLITMQISKTNVRDPTYQCDMDLAGLSTSLFNNLVDTNYMLDFKD